MRVRRSAARRQEWPDASPCPCQIAFDVLDFHGRIVYENADRQRQSSQGHDVDRFSDRAQKNDGDKDRKWNRDRDDDGWPPVAEKNEDHDGGERSGDDPFAQNSVNGSPDEQRLIKQSGDFKLRRQRLCSLLHDALHRLHDLQCRRFADLVN